MPDEIKSSFQRDGIQNFTVSYMKNKYFEDPLLHLRQEAPIYSSNSP